MSWERIKNPPDWVAEAAAQKRLALSRGELDEPLLGTSRIFYGDTYVYRVDFLHKNHGRARKFHRQLKSDYFDTTSEEALLD